MEIFAIIGLAALTYLFINRGLIPLERRRSRGARVGVATGWGVAYALLAGIVLGPLGILIGLGVGTYAFLR